MKLSPSFDLILQLAGHEMVAGEFALLEPEHFCLALLKFAELSGKIEVSGSHNTDFLQDVTREIGGVQAEITRRGIKSTPARRALRRKLGKGGESYSGGNIRRSGSSRVLFGSAENLARDSGSSILTPEHLLRALLQAPTPYVAEVVLDDASASVSSPTIPTSLPRSFCDLVKSATPASHSSLQPETRALLLALQHPCRKAVVLLSENAGLPQQIVRELAAKMASNAELLPGRCLLEVKSPYVDAAGDPEALNLKVIETAITCEAVARVAAAPDAVLLLPYVSNWEPADEREWRLRLYRDAVAHGAAYVICPIQTALFTEEFRRDPAWKGRMQTIWLADPGARSIPREL